MTQTNTTQNKEELEEVTIERIVDDFIESDNQKLFRNQCVRDLKELLSQAHQSGIEEERKRIKFKIGMLRQWLNERSSTFIITNEVLEYWLLDRKLSTESLKENK